MDAASYKTHHIFPIVQGMASLIPYIHYPPHMLPYYLLFLPFSQGPLKGAHASIMEIQTILRGHVRTHSNVSTVIVLAIYIHIFRSFTPLQTAFFHSLSKILPLYYPTYTKQNLNPPKFLWPNSISFQNPGLLKTIMS